MKKPSFENLKSSLFQKMELEELKTVKGGTGETIKRTCCTQTHDPNCSPDHDCSDIEPDCESIY